MLRYLSLAVTILTTSGVFLLASLNARAQDQANNTNGSALPFVVRAYAEIYYGFADDRLVGDRKPSFMVSSPKTAIALRAEYYDDRHVIIASSTPNGFKTLGFSTNFDYNLTKNILWRVEARTLRSKDKIFTRNDGSSADSSLFVTTSLAVNF